MSSDHKPVLLTLWRQVATINQKCKLHNEKTNWTNFWTRIEETLNIKISLRNENDITAAVEHLNNCIQQAAWESSPFTGMRDLMLNYSQKIRDKVIEKRKLCKQWQLTRCPKLKTKLNYTIKQLKLLLDEERNSCIRNYLQNLDTTASSEYSLWKATRKLKQPQTVFPPLRRPDGSWAQSDSDKANTFVEHLTKVFTPNAYEGLPEYELEILNTLKTPCDSDIKLKNITKKEVVTAIIKTNPKKAPGYDLITGQVLKELPDAGITFLTQLYNATLRLRFFPPQWKIAQTIMILKPGKSSEDPKSYRPISLLPIISKMLEKLFLRRLMPIIEERKIIPDHQFGFRSKHSTVDQIHRIVKKITYCP